MKLFISIFPGILLTMVFGSLAGCNSAIDVIVPLENGRFFSVETGPLQWVNDAEPKGLLNSSGQIIRNSSLHSETQTGLEIDGIVTGIDAAAGVLKIEGIEIATSISTEYRDDSDQSLSREAFFALLRQGVSVVKVKWHPFTGYDQPPRRLEIES